MPPTLAPITIPAWTSLPWLIHAFSTRQGGATTAYRPQGDLNLGFTPADPAETVAANRELFLAHLETTPNLVTLRQTHSATIHRVHPTDAQPPTARPHLEGDGLLTDTPGTLLAILTADCVPVLVLDPRHRAVAAFHAGWRGTVAQIVEQGIASMQKEVSSNPEELQAAIGPAIGPCCYTVGEELREKFTATFPYANHLFTTNETGLHLDLPEANRRQLLSAGLSEAAITLTQACTSCDTTRFFSHRAEQAKTGRQMAVIGLRP